MSEESIEHITKSDSNFPPTFVHHHVLPDVIKTNISIPKKVIYIFLTH